MKTTGTLVNGMLVQKDTASQAKQEKQSDKPAASEKEAKADKA